jgi:hypothetical protein
VINPKIEEIEKIQQVSVNQNSINISNNDRNKKNLVQDSYIAS